MAAEVNLQSSSTSDNPSITEDPTPEELNNLAAQLANTTLDESANADSDSKISKPQPPPMPAEPISIDIFRLIHRARSNHGVPTEDFTTYRRFLSKKLAELRRELKIQCLDPKNTIKDNKRNQKRRAEEKRMKSKQKWKRDPDRDPKVKKPRIKKEITWQNRRVSAHDVIACQKSITIQLYLCERAWSYSRSLYEQYDEDHSRKYHHSNRRLRKAIANAEAMTAILEPISTGNTILQCTAYCAWLRSSYFLQRELVEDALSEYLTWQSLSSLFGHALCLENGDDTAVRDKLTYFNQGVNSMNFSKIRQSVTAEVEEMKSKFGYDSSAEKQSQVTEQGSGPEIEIEFGTRRVSVPNVSNLRTLITEFVGERAKLIAAGKSRATYNMEKLAKMVLKIQKALNVVQKETGKFTLNASDDANAYLVTERYLNFERLRLTVCRQSMWMGSKLFKKRDKLTRNYRLVFEFATLSERQVTNLDEMAGLIDDVAKYSEFERQRMMLRRRFEISRNFYIAHLLFHAKQQFLETMKVLDEVVIESLQSFLADYSDFKTDKVTKFEGNIFDFAVFTRMERHYEAMEQTLRDAKRLSMMAKAEHILAGYGDDTEAMVNDPYYDLRLVDNGKSPFWKQEMLPILDKPVMIDVAWNFVDYQDILDSQKNPTSNTANDASRPNHVQKQSSWFGGLFGQ